jgi:hypothetical protein
VDARLREWMAQPQKRRIRDEWLALLIDVASRDSYQQNVIVCAWDDGKYVFVLRVVRSGTRVEMQNGDGFQRCY